MYPCVFKRAINKVFAPGSAEPRSRPRLPPCVLGVSGLHRPPSSRSFWNLRAAFDASFLSASTSLMSRPCENRLPESVLRVCCGSPSLATQPRPPASPCGSLSCLPTGPRGSRLSPSSYCCSWQLESQLETKSRHCPVRNLSPPSLSSHRDLAHLRCHPQPELLFLPSPPGHSGLPFLQLVPLSSLGPSLSVSFLHVGSHVAQFLMTLKPHQLKHFILIKNHGLARVTLHDICSLHLRRLSRCK